MTIKAEAGNWDKDFAPKDTSKDSSSGSTGGNGKLPYMKFPEAGEYRIRLVGGHVKYYKWWKPIVAITHQDYRKEDPAWKAGWYPSKRYCIHIIDRADGKLKLLDKGNSIFKTFASFKAVNNINPAGADAPDFVITVTIPKIKGKPDPRNASYEVVATQKNTPLTDAEKAMYKEQRVSLQDMCQAYSLEKIQELWDALPESEKIPPKKDDDGKYSNEKQSSKSNQSGPKAETEEEDEVATEVSASGGSELFEDSDNAEGAKNEDSTELF